MFSVIYYQLFWTQLFRIPRYFELIFLEVPLPRYFKLVKKQSTYITAQLESHFIRACLINDLTMLDSHAVSR